MMNRSTQRRQREAVSVVHLVFYILIPLAVVLVVAVAFDLRARRHRHLAAEFRESGRVSGRRAAQTRDATNARDRPTRMGKGPTGGPSLGP
jgi:hypothetical protein